MHLIYFVIDEYNIPYSIIALIHALNSTTFHQNCYCNLKNQGYKKWGRGSNFFNTIISVHFPNNESLYNDRIVHHYLSHPMYLEY